ncbi:MAG: hypothetical protein ACI8TP_002056 [Acidimicrobiales bacterium]
MLRSAGLDPADAYAGLNFAVSYVMGHATEAFRDSEQRLFQVGLELVISGLRDCFNLS